MMGVSLLWRPKSQKDDALCSTHTAANYTPIIW